MNLEHNGLDSYKINITSIRAHKYNSYIELYKHNFLDKHVYYNKCYCNEFSALTNRHILKPLDSYNPNKTKILLEPIKNCLLKLVQSNVLQYNHKEVMNSTRKSIFRRYNNAYRTLLTNRLSYNEINGRLDSFVKYEKWSLEKILAGKTPRVVQHRSFEFLYLNKSFMLPIVSKLKSCSDFIYGQEVNSIFMKYYKNYQQINIIRKYWNKFKHPVCLCLDMKAFDGHVTTSLLEIEQSFWLSFYTGLDFRVLKKLYKSQLTNIGMTKGGIKFKKKGSRVSGDYSTSDGNSLINYLMLRAYLNYLKIDGYIFVNGDDSMVIIEKPNVEFDLNTLSFFNIFGMECECDRIAEYFEDINFCQANPVRINNNYRFVKSPFRTMSRTTVCPSQYINCIDRYLSGIGLCELASNVGVPILQAWSLKLLFDSGFTKPLGSIDKSYSLFVNEELITINPISEDTRQSFSMAFKISPLEQIELENFLLTGHSISNPKLINFINKYNKFHKH